MAGKTPTVPDGYQELLSELKERLTSAQVRAALAVNRELVLLYWRIGRDILERQTRAGWGSKVVERLSKDLRLAFPGMKGLSRANLMYMRAFAEAYPDEAIVQQAVGQIPWGHNLLLLDRVKDPETRLWYAARVSEHGWSRNVLSLQVESALHARAGRAVSNFAATLPPPQSDLAQGITKDPYVFDFLTVAEDARELEVEGELVSHMIKFLLELGAGFAFLGRQVPLEVAGEEYLLDLLFYHVRLHCYVVMDLKTGPFKPEYAGKMNFYLSAVDDQMRSGPDQPTIGLILCREKNGVTAEYALRDIGKPIGVADYRLTRSLPENLRTSLPTVEALQAELSATTEKAEGGKAKKRR
jgi:predicted nuclease of restriction endonuclease-like (RecB) superfamily